MKIIIEKEQKDKPLKKDVCPECFNQMHKRKEFYICYKCGTKVVPKKLNKVFIRNKVFRKE